MQSTGKEKFMVYVYFKTEKYDPNNPWSDTDSEPEEYQSDEDSSIVSEPFDNPNWLDTEIKQKQKEKLQIEINKSSLKSSVFKRRKS